MPIYHKIIRLLEENDVRFEMLEHKIVKTSAEASKIRGSSLSEGAKALIFEADNKPILIIVSGDRKVSLAKFKISFNVKDLRLVSAAEVKKITGLEVGAIPPVGPVLGLPTYCDQAVLDRETMVFNAGSWTKSIRMKTADFSKIILPVIGNFSTMG